MGNAAEKIQIEKIYYLENLNQLEAMSSRLRHRLIEQLTYTPKNTAQLARAIDVTRPKAYYHIKVLEGNGLVKPAYNKLVNGILEKYYISRAHFFSYDKLAEYANAHPDDITYNKRFTQASNDFLSCVLDVSYRKIRTLDDEQGSDNFVFNFGVHLTDEQINVVVEKMGELANQIREIHAGNVEREDYLQLPYFKTILVNLPLKSPVDEAPNL